MYREYIPTGSCLDMDRSKRTNNRQFRTSNQDYGYGIPNRNHATTVDYSGRNNDLRRVVATGTTFDNFSKEENIIGAGRLQYDLFNHDSILMYRDVLRLMEHNKTFRKFLTNIFKALPLTAYVWEVVPVTDTEAASTPFQFVITESNSLNRMTKDSQTFASHFKRSTNPYVTSFLNLGRDAKLVAPLPATKLLIMECDYSHIGKFMTDAPDEQIDALWIEVAKAMSERLSDSPKMPLWLSTAGHGVAWLHVRIDITPKYYSHTPYKTFHKGGFKGVGENKMSKKAEIDEIFKAENKKSSTKYRREDKTYMTDKLLAESLAQEERDRYGIHDSYKPRKEDAYETRKPRRELSQRRSEKYDWSISEGYANHGQTMLYTFTYNDDVLTYIEAIQRLKTDPTFRRIFTSIFKDCQHEFYKWELIPVKSTTANKTKFEVAFINMVGSYDPTLSPRNFRSLLKSHDNEMILYHADEQANYVALNPFYNGRLAASRKCSHIGEFARHAAAETVDEFWKVIGQALSEYLDGHPRQSVCLSSCQTSSADQSVYVRIDSQPSSYKHRPFQTTDFGDKRMDWH
ncbi:uncharacterized protein LOC130644705 isoform X1 [Hydractinia symbiolongicarpus]|uniref:uncharacterized protein LOC130644705 isoform X1 n=1 Tax=Hydractinia symbiolongicarpus TaxID=13093 RepID=UPI002551ABC6|nr:uncharacterized protein LOC130644705 isoform X1 [Hydractinia symbiolongicarpus]